MGLDTTHKILDEKGSNHTWLLKNGVAYSYCAQRYGALLLWDMISIIFSSTRHGCRVVKLKDFIWRDTSHQSFFQGDFPFLHVIFTRGPSTSVHFACTDNAKSPILLPLHAQCSLVWYQGQVLLKATSISRIDHDRIWTGMGFNSLTLETIASM